MKLEEARIAAEQVTGYRPRPAGILVAAHATTTAVRVSACGQERTVSSALTRIAHQPY